MEEKNLMEQTEKTFENIKHVDENGVEFWYARELMTTLEYTKWGNFKNVISKAKKLAKTVISILLNTLPASGGC